MNEPRRTYAAAGRKSRISSSLRETFFLTINSRFSETNENREFFERNAVGTLVFFSCFLIIKETVP